MAKEGENWKCAHCGHAQVLSSERLEKGWNRQDVTGWKYANQRPAIFTETIVCSNAQCGELSLRAILAKASFGTAGKIDFPYLATWTLVPPSSAKPQPDCIPQPIRDDYYEACSVRDLSPKASATLIRRCLQGMIRDFCGIKKGTLFEEIKELRQRANDGNAPLGVQPDSVEAIDQVRGIGNIGAHMEADINVIIDVDPDEAQILIELTELLFREWYVAREARALGLARIKHIAEQKKLQKQFPALPASPPEDATS
jgi:Domain of unknown function (DUF4145)